MTYWEVYFSDGTFVSSKDATPFSIEHREDVQVIIQEEKEHVWRTLTAEYYVWDDRGEGPKWWRVNDQFGLDWYFRKPGEKCVLFGTWIEKDDFRRIFNKARANFGEKSGFDADEQLP